MFNFRFLLHVLIFFCLTFVPMAFNNASKNKSSNNTSSILSQHSTNGETAAKTISGSLVFSQMEEEVESHSFNISNEVRLTPYSFFIGLDHETALNQCSGYFTQESPPPDFIS